MWFLVGPGAGSSDNVGHIPVWGSIRSFFPSHAVAYGFWVWILVQGSAALGFTDGDCPGNLSLGQHTGDGKFDGETFLGRTWMFFCEGRGRGRGSVRVSTPESFSQDDTRFQTVPFFMLYIIY